MTVQRVSPGQSFRPRAADWNQFAAAANAHQAQSAPIASPGRQAWPYDRGAVWVRNGTAAAIGLYSVVGIGEPYSPAPAGTDWGAVQSGTMVFSVASVSDSVPCGVLQSALGPGEVGRVILSDVTPVYLAVTDSSHRYATATPSETYLTSAEDGPVEILWKQSGTGTKLAVARLGDRVGEATESATQAAWFAIDGTTVTVTFDGMIVYQDGSMESATQVMTFTVTDTWASSIVFGARSDISTSHPLIWTVYGGYSASFSAADSDTTDWERESTFWNGGSYGEWHPANIACVLDIEERRSTSDPIVASWKIAPGEAIRLTAPRPRIRYSETLQRLHWTGGDATGGSTVLSVPASTNGSIYGVGAWKAYPGLSFSTTGASWYMTLGTIQTDADGKAVKFSHYSTPREAMKRYGP